MMVTLKLTDGPAAGKIFEFSEADTFVVGRSPKAHLRIGLKADRHLSRIHFLIDIRPPRCIIIDLNSKNGTFVNGERITQSSLEDGDVIKAGQTSIKVTIQKGLVKEEDESGRVVCSVCAKDVTSEAREKHSPETGFLAYTCKSCLEKEKEDLHKKALDLLKITVPTIEPSYGGLDQVNNSITCHCMNCGADLTEKANSDGQAATFDNALYLCINCALSLQEKDTDYTWIEDYLVLGVIGKGGMGLVYKAVHQPTRRIYAIKMILPDLVWNEHASKLFEREMKMQAQISHKNLVRFMGHGKVDKVPYFVTEYLHGGDVKQLVTETFYGPLPPALALRIAVQILTGLQALHGRGLIHRDIKPSNCLLDRSHKDKKFLVKIADHGLVKSYENAGNSIYPYTKTGEILGSFAFIPPEQITNYRFCKPPGDVYSAGATLYYMLTEKYTADFPPFLLGSPDQPPTTGQRNKHPVEIILEAPQIPLLDRRPDLPKKLGEVVDKAVKKNLDQRHQTAGELLRDLKKVMGEQGWDRD